MSVHTHWPCTVYAQLKEQACVGSSESAIAEQPHVSSWKYSAPWQPLYLQQDCRVDRKLCRFAEVEGFDCMPDERTYMFVERVSSAASSDEEPGAVGSCLRRSALTKCCSKYALRQH